MEKKGRERKMRLEHINSDGERYLVEGALLFCEASDVMGELKLPNNHGVYDAADSPLINIEDSDYPENIPNFGICKITGEPCVPSIEGDWNTTNTTMMIGSASAESTDALGNSERYTYDSVGQLTEKLDKDRNAA